MLLSPVKVRRKRRPAEQTTHFEGLPVDVEVTGIALRDIAFHSGSLDLELQKADLAVSARIKPSGSLRRHSLGLR